MFVETKRMGYGAENGIRGREQKTYIDPLMETKGFRLAVAFNDLGWRERETQNTLMAQGGDNIIANIKPGGHGF